MSISKFYTETATIKRLTPDGVNPDIVDYQSVGTIACHLQQVSAEEAALVGGVFGKTWRLWCDRGVDIKETDRVGISGRDYTVSGIKDLFVNQALNKHLEVTLIDDLS